MKKLSAMYCEHANEMPNVCPCPDNCYCKDHSCKPVKIKRCSNADKYKGTREPCCNDGNPCDACERKFKSQGKKKERMRSREAILKEIERLREKRIGYVFDPPIEIDILINALKWTLMEVDHSILNEY
jgi:hypothetical protein